MSLWVWYYLYAHLIVLHVAMTMHANNLTNYFPLWYKKGIVVASIAFVLHIIFMQKSRPKYVTIFTTYIITDFKLT